MPYLLNLILVAFISFEAAGKDCAKEVEKLARQQVEKEDYSRRGEFGIRHDGTRVLPPNKCTPFMREKKMISLSKRKSAGVNRERYMDSDCNVYEWDYQHGKFEKYELSGTTLRHVGEVSPVLGAINEDKTDSKRDYRDHNTGYDGYDMKKLCREHKNGRLNDRTIENRSLGFKCF